MSFKIDLKIFLFLILFYFTNQIETYILILIFAFIHELGHLVCGLALGMKPRKLEIKPYGVSISFKIVPKDYNNKILNGNLLELKKIIVALAGQMHWDLGGIEPLNQQMEVILLFVVLVCIILVVKRKLIGALLLTLISSILIFYIKNIAIFIAIIFLWVIYIIEDLKFRKRNKIYKLVEKTIEINAN